VDEPTGKVTEHGLKPQAHHQDFCGGLETKMKIKHDETINQLQNFPGVGFSIRIDIRNPGGFLLHLNATDRHGISAAFPGRC
jgi:hypothetical protein